MKLSEHFTLEEMCFSEVADRKGIDNIPEEDVLHNLMHTAQCMEQVRYVLKNNPIHINSGYRCDSLNDAIGGSRTGQHPKGEAVDFTCRSFGTPYEVALAISTSGVKYDQLIYEGNWVHISFKKDGNRGQTMTAKFITGRPVYYHGITR